MSSHIIPLHDEMSFEQEALAAAADFERWRVLIVDDEPDVHQATTFALKEAVILDRHLEFLHAYNGDQAIKLLATETDIAVVLLDVVMEGEEDGLLVARAIRDELNLQEIRIVLRTGHPGYAPEYQVIRDYGINDYKTKSDLTQVRLMTTLTAAIRSYQQLKIINTSRRGLEMIVEASALLFERRSLESFAAGALTQLAALLGLAPDGLICTHQPRSPGLRPAQDWTIVSAAGELQPLINQPLHALDRPEVLNAIEHAIRSRSSIYSPRFTVLYLRRPSAQEAAIYLDTGRPIPLADQQLLEIFCSNIAVGFENIALFKQLQDLAYIDPLCHIPNRTQFVSRLNHLLQYPQPDQIVVLLDIAQFSQINDALGHLIGDQLLQSVSQRLRALVPPSVALAHIGVDLFGLAGREADIGLDRLHAAFAKPFNVGTHLLRIKITSSAARLTDTEATGIGCLKDVTIGLNLAKREGPGSFTWYSPAMSLASRQRLELLHDLEAAIRQQQLLVYYQPQISLRDGAVIGMEALLRWPLQNGQFIGPDRFIPLAEQSGLIIELGDWLLGKVCEQMVAWRNEGLGDLKVAINVSMVQFNHDTLVDQLALRLRQFGVKPSQIEIEITESVAMQTLEDVIDTIRRLKQLGVTVSIDDFGTGFSSLAYLQKLNADRLKIDRSFIREIGANEGSLSIAEMVINLGHKLGIAVLAEGVETAEQAALLRASGCDEAQGYLFAKPAPARMLGQWLRETEGRVLIGAPTQTVHP
ncbi:EAL domain-containing protein [Silvimonas sp. JCM 19000]